MKPVALVTGGSRGIGLAISKILAENGYDIAFNGVRDPSQVQDVIDDIKSLGAEVVYCQGDVSEPSGREKVLNTLKEQFGRLNVLVNNAGVGPKQRVDPLEDTEESYERVMRINLQGPYFLTQAVARWMVEQKQQDDSYQGCMINIGSISATVVSSDRAEYCMSKAGFAMMSKVWAVKMAEYDIPVYEVRPGVTQTDMTAKVKDKYDRLISEGLTIQPRWGQPEDVAKSVLSLVQGYFPYSTGEVIMVDGGLTIPRL